MLIFFLLLLAMLILAGAYRGVVSRAQHESAFDAACAGLSRITVERKFRLFSPANNECVAMGLYHERPFRVFYRYRMGWFRLSRAKANFVVHTNQNEAANEFLKSSAFQDAVQMMRLPFDHFEVHRGCMAIGFGRGAVGYFIPGDVRAMLEAFLPVANEYE